MNVRRSDPFNNSPETNHNEAQSNNFSHLHKVLEELPRPVNDLRAELCRRYHEVGHKQLFNHQRRHSLLALLYADIGPVFSIGMPRVPQITEFSESIVGNMSVFPDNLEIAIIELSVRWLNVAQHIANNKLLFVGGGHFNDRKSSYLSITDKGGLGQCFVTDNLYRSIISG